MAAVAWGRVVETLRCSQVPPQVGTAFRLTRLGRGTNSPSRSLTHDGPDNPPRDSNQPETANPAARMNRRPRNIRVRLSCPQARVLVQPAWSCRKFRFCGRGSTRLACQGFAIMKYPVAIMVCAAFFALLGTLCAWGAADYYMSGGRDSSGRDTAALLFVLLPLGGSAVGVVVGCIAVYFGKRHTVPADGAS